MSLTKNEVIEMLAMADIKINGDRPGDIVVHDDRMYSRMLAEGNFGLGESYMSGWWDSPSIDQFIYKILSAELNKKVKLNWRIIMAGAQSLLLNFQSKNRAFLIGERHYDIGNDLYAAMLDKRMTYTCGYWAGANNLDEAQENKLELVCKKINLQPGQRILDIGCGWGSFVKYAAEKYGVSAVGVTVSKEQAKLARESVAGLPIEIRLSDYREVSEKFDHVVSLGMFEHVGYKNYRAYMQVVNRNLKDNGLFLLHTIGANHSTTMNEPWTDKYIFPNSMLPSISQIGSAIENIFVMEDWHSFGADYDKTLMAWQKNFSLHWPEFEDKYNQTFYRMWNYFLLSCAGSFRTRHTQLWQIVLSKNGVPGGYKSIR